MADLDPLQAFRLIDARREDSPHRDQLTTLRQRGAGELLSAPDLVDETLGADFELVTHTGGASAVLDRAGAIAATARLGPVLVWGVIADLVADDAGIAMHGLLRTLAGTSLTTMTIAYFARFDGKQMTSEVVYLDAPSQATVADDVGLPPREQLRDLLGYRRDRQWS